MVLSVSLDDAKQRAAWQRLADRNIMEAQRDSGPDLLELILRTEGFPEPLLELLGRLRQAMALFWNDRSITVPLIAKKDITHNRRILFYLASILFPHDLEWERKGQKRVPCIYPMLDLCDLFVLLCAVYLHDYAKGQYVLIIPELTDPEDKTAFESAPVAANLDPRQHALLEGYHAHTIQSFLFHFLSRATLPELKDSLRARYDKRLQMFIEAIGSPPTGLDGASGSDAALAQKHLFDVLWSLAGYQTDPSQPHLLAQIAMISAAHKAHQLSAPGPDQPPADDIFDTLRGSRHDRGRLSLLAALLRIADNLDLTRQRLETAGGLPEYFSNWVEQGAPRDTPETLQRLFTKWLTFAVVREVHIDHRFPPDETLASHGPTALEITLLYERFEGWRDHFLTLRSQVEKDFLATNYLATLCRRDRNTEIKLQLLYELADATPFTVAGGPLRIVGALHTRLASLSLPRAIQPAEKFSTVGAGRSLSFSPLAAHGPTFQLATHLDLLYLLGYIDTNGPESCAVISARMALAFASELVAASRDAVSEGRLLQKTTDDRVAFCDDDAGQRAREILDVFRQHPALLREKIRELQAFGHILPFSPREIDTVPTGIDGINKILSPLRRRTGEPAGLQHARNLLVVGGPGTGKTTLLVQILHCNHNTTQHRVLMLTFEELVPLLTSTYLRDFGWELPFIRGIQVGPTFEATLEGIHRMIEAEAPDLIAIDGLSRLRGQTDKQSREQIDILFKSLHIRGITCIASLENSTIAGPLEQYQADSVLQLRQEGVSRQLEIKKLRGQDPVPGWHAFEILDHAHLEMERAHLLEEDRHRSPLQPGINVYPNDLYYASAGEATESEPAELCFIPTGVQNLDALLPGRRAGEKGYHRGETILVLGSPGAGKTLFGLHFLKADLETPKPSGQHVFWLSFEGPRSLLERSVASFDESAGFRQLLGGGDLIFKFVPFARISPEKVLYYVIELVQRFKVSRLVVDSVSEINEAFNDKARFRQYMTTFIQALMPLQVTTLFLYRVPEFFRSAHENDSEIATLVDTIISIKTFDMKNRIRRGLFVLKSRGRELRSQLQTMDIHARCGIQLSYKGWEMEGLLSGETGSIHEPEVFLKHFYENPAESRINKAIVKQFLRRYPGKGRFTEVRKQAVYSEFWSFRGNYGAGHSNVRVASISRYMVEAFRERGALHDLDDFFPEHLKEKIARDPRWRRYETELQQHDSVPLYTDIGVLLVRRDLAQSFLPCDQRLEDGACCLAHLADESSVGWATLKNLSARATRPHDSPWAFALPYLYNRTEFMAFFFEILWTRGGDVFHFPVFDGGAAGRRDTFYKDHIFLNKDAWRKLQAILENMAQQPANALPRARIEPLLATLERLEETRQDSAGRVTAPLAAPVAPRSEQAGGPPRRLAALIQHKILDNPRFLIDDDDIFTIDNRLGVAALGFLYDLVFDASGAVPNPYDGDLRYNALFSRRWYSQVQGVPDEVAGRRGEEKARRGREHRGSPPGPAPRPAASAEPPATAPSAEPTPARVSEADLEILPLPYFSSGSGKECCHRSCTCENVWCLCLVKEALSPEIGWIYIDSLISEEWVEARAAQRCGLPYAVQDITSKERHDPGVYRMLDEVVNTKQKKDEIYAAEQDIVARYDGIAADEIHTRVAKAVGEFFAGEYHLRDVRDVLHALSRISDSDDRRARETLFFEGLKPADRRALEDCQEQGLRVSETDNFERFPGIPLRSRLPDHRPLFHRVESILHDEIVTLFSDEGREEWAAELRQDFQGSGADEVLRAARRADGQRGPSGLITRALQRMHDRLIFDLLTGYPGELEKRWPRPVAPAPSR